MGIQNTTYWIVNCLPTVPMRGEKMKVVMATSDVILFCCYRVCSGPHLLVTLPLTVLIC